MNPFESRWKVFWNAFGDGKKMVLSTSWMNQVTSRMMSVVQKEGVFYFQTDKTSRKYQQLSQNKNIALCTDNIQIEGTCKELGHPLDHAVFCSLYKACFPNHFNEYSSLKNETLFEVAPLYVKCWIYQDGNPFEEIFEFQTQTYRLLEYQGV